MSPKPKRQRKTTSLKRHPVSGKLSGGKPSKPSPSELAKADASTYVRRSGPMSVFDKHPEVAEYMQASCELIRAGKSTLTVRELCERIRKHFGVEVSHNAAQKYVIDRYGGMRALMYG